LKAEPQTEPGPWTCPDCGKRAIPKTSKIGDREFTFYAPPCDCREKRETKEAARAQDRLVPSLLREAGAPERYIRDRETGILEDRKIARPAKQMAKTPGEGTGFWLLGNVGKGKTTSACHVIEAWVRAGKRCRYVSLPDLISRKECKDIAEDLTRCDLAVVDDIGYQKEGKGRFVFSLVDGLYRALTPTIYTTSQTIEGIRYSVGDFETGKAVLDRMKTYGVWKLSGEESLRKDPGRAPGKGEKE